MTLLRLPSVCSPVLSCPVPSRPVPSRPVPVLSHFLCLLCLSLSLSLFDVVFVVMLCCVCAVRHAEKLPVIAAHVGVPFFAHFLEKKRITFHDVCFSKPLTFHNDFMFFWFSQLFQALFETTSPTYFTSQVVGLVVSKSS